MSESFLDDLARALDGGPAVILPAPGGQARHTVARTVTGFEHTAPPSLVVFTSGSTGWPKGVALSARALRASAEATLEALGGPGAWYLPLPLTHIAGAQVAVRALLAGERPFPATPGSFTAETFRADIARMRANSGESRRSYTSLVPTQLQRILEDPAATEAAAGFDAILVGGASLPEATRERARDRGLSIVRTYGMSETAGGCVYDGVPLPGVRVDLLPHPAAAPALETPPAAQGRQSAEAIHGSERVQASSAARPGSAGRIALAGPMVAEGYVSVDGGAVRLLTGPSPFDPPHEAPVGQIGEAAPDARRFLTSDLGRIEEGALAVLGRSDDVLISGGVNVHPLRVEAAALDAFPHLPGILVTGVPDDAWGTRLVALVPAPLPPDFLRELRERLRTRLEPAELPTEVLAVEALPQRGIGKPDRRAAAARARELLAPG